MEEKTSKTSKDSAEAFANTLVDQMYDDVDGDYDENVVNVVKAIQKQRIINNIENSEKNADDYSRRFNKSENRTGCSILAIKILLVWAAVMLFLGIILRLSI